MYKIVLGSRQYSWYKEAGYDMTNFIENKPLVVTPVIRKKTKHYWRDIK